MTPRRKAWVFLLGALAITLGSWSDLRSEGFTSVGGFTVDGNKVEVSVVNDADTDEGVLITVVAHGARQRYEASTRVQVPAGSTAVGSIVLGTITDDINPLDVKVTLQLIP